MGCIESLSAGEVIGSKQHRSFQANIIEYSFRGLNLSEKIHTWKYNSATGGTTLFFLA